MNNQERHVALDLIANAQEDCSSVTVQIGGTGDNGIVEHDTLYIDECPASVVNKLVDNGFSLSMTEEGLRVDKY